MNRGVLKSLWCCRMCMSLGMLNSHKWLNLCIIKVRLCLMKLISDYINQIAMRIMMKMLIRCDIWILWNAILCLISTHIAASLFISSWAFSSHSTIQVQFSIINAVCWIKIFSFLYSVKHSHYITLSNYNLILKWHSTLKVCCFEQVES